MRVHLILQMFTGTSNIKLNPCTTIPKGWAHLWDSVYTQTSMHISNDVYIQPDVVLSVHMTPHCVHHQNVKAQKELNTHRVLFVIQQVCRSHLQKYPLETWLKAFQACIRGSPFRALFLFFTLTWFQIALSSPSLCYHLNPHLIPTFIRSFVCSFIHSPNVFSMPVAG